jgi:hypothetical protein
MILARSGAGHRGRADASIQEELGPLPVLAGDDQRILGR